MVCLGNLWLSTVDEQGGLGTGKMVRLGNLWLSNVA